MRGDGLRRGRALSPEKPHVPSGSSADIQSGSGDVRFIPRSRHAHLRPSLNASYIYEQAIWPWDPLDRSVGG
jgi:hypothetical protein